MSDDALTRWHEVVETKDRATLADILHPDVVFESPVVHTPQHGRDITLAYLTGAMMVLNGPDFRYTGEWHSDTGAVLEFQTQIDGIAINGVDIITLSADCSQITHFKVMIRPLKAINLVHQKMGELLAQMGAIKG